ncbi:uncharacterized protein CTRU02_211808 [Colletotrichum truncatum]|uniref:Uncharacterized protein n=1 Tax=Colletotrichum truncatum TaxID=5467 RepID=A0ACC3YLR3_COLTU|nr:uncharacterized protein CTRU02_07216 [Colletotrichum truncatum]KAF6791454.1 hypothetical protein CTRU02_07216 [Colletotrichum truncatum]
MPESSDESTAEGVGLVQNDASDSESSVDSGSDEDQQGHGFLDVEASESGESGSESDSDSSDSDSDEDSIPGRRGGRHGGPRAVFTQFKKLPIELRHRIWQFFCPDLHSSPRVLSFQILCSPQQDVIWEGAVLENQIHPVNAMLGVHQESREIALKAFPDTLAIRQGRRIIHVNKKRDVIHLNGHRKSWNHNAFVRGFSENILNLALDIPHLNAMELRIFTAFPNLVNVFKFEWHNEGRAPLRLRWCASDEIHRYEIQQLQKDFRVGEDLHFVYCWPDVDKHRDFAEKHASENADAGEALDELEEAREGDEELAEMVKDNVIEKLRGIDFWRMTCFGWDAADRFPAFLAKHGKAAGDTPSEDEDEQEESSEEDEDTDQNEYESDDIDDATIDEESVNEDEDDLLIDNREDSEDEEEGGASDFGGFSPLRDEDGSILADGPEPNSVGGNRHRRGGRAIMSSDDEDEDEEVERSARGATRRSAMVVSDEEDEEEEEEEAKPSQNTVRSRRVILSDDEDDDEEEETTKPARSVGRRARVLPSDDEDEDEDEGGAEVGTTDLKEGSDSEDEPAGSKRPMSLAEKLQNNRRRNPIPDEEDSDEETSEEGEAPPKKLSLAQKLMAHRRRNPIESEPEDSEGSVVDEDDDDEEDEEDEDDENGMFMNMADEGESDDEQDDDEY